MDRKKLAAAGSRVGNRRDCILSLAGLTLAGWAQAGAATGPKATSRTLLVLGDSLSAEYGIERGRGWVALLEARLRAQGLPTEVINASISGDTTHGGRSRLPALLQARRPTHVVIELGANDALRGLPLAQTAENLGEMIEAVRKARARALLVGMQVPPNYGRRYADDFAALFARVAKERQVPLVPFLLSGVADAPGDKRSWFQPDGLHPLAEAHPRMLENVWRVAEPWLKAA